MNLNEKLVELRKAKGLTQKELAGALNVTRQAVSRWEVGTAAPSLDNLAFLSRLYGVPLDDFIQEEGAGAETLEEPAGAPASQEPLPVPAPVGAGRPHVPLALTLFLAVLILGVGILIGMRLPREKPSSLDVNRRVDVSGPVGRLEQTPKDVQDELQWLETTVKDLLENQLPP